MQQALTLEPDSVVVRALAAVQARRQGDPARALEYLYDLVGEEPEEPIWQVEMGAALAQAGDLPGAYQAYNQAAAMAPQTPLYWQYLAGFSIQYNYDLAGVGLAAARRAVILAPEDPASQDVMGMVLLSVGDWASAERYLQHALAGDATYAPAALHLGMLYLRQEMYDQAHPYLQRALSLDADGATGQVARRLLRQNYGEQ
jgi:tetratricopeptide (TPR) repeat protein